ncbi:MAG: DUF6444 domain-containing protein [Rhodopila sp.]
MTQLPDLSRLSHDEKDALIRALWAQVQALTARVAALEARLEAPPKTPDNASLPPSAGQKAKRGETPKRRGPRQGSLGRQGGGRDLVEYPDETVIARLVCCAHCQAALDEADQKLAARYDKVDLPPVRPVVTRVERYTGSAVAAATPRWRRCLRVWSRARRSAATSWRWRSTCGLCMR